MAEDAREGFETLIRFATLGEARVAAGLLEAAGIEAFVPDEVTTNVAPHLSNALGGYRLQVPRDDVARARAALAQDDAEDDERALHRETRDADDPRPGPREAAALRAWRAAIIGLIVFPPLLHLFSLTQLAVVLSSSEPLPAPARWRALAALVIDAVAILVSLALLQALYSPYSPSSPSRVPGLSF